MTDPAWTGISADQHGDLDHAAVADGPGAASSAVAAHQADTTNVHGITDTAGLVRSIVEGANVTVDATDPANPVVSATGGGGGAVDSVNGQTGVVALTAEDVGSVPAALPFTVETRDGYTVIVVPTPEGWAGGKGVPAVGFGLPGEDHARMVVFADGQINYATGDADPAVNANHDGDLYPNEVDSTPGLATDGSFQAYGGLYDDNDDLVRAASFAPSNIADLGTLLPLASPPATVDTVGSWRVVRLSNHEALHASGVTGEAFPRFLLDIDGALHYSDGTYDPTSGPSISVFDEDGNLYLSTPVTDIVLAPGTGRNVVVATDAVFAAGFGPVMRSPNGTLYRQTVANDGTPSMEVVT